MSVAKPVALNAGHILDGFDCGKPALNDWLLRHARQAQASGSARTFVVTNGNQLVGYSSLTIGQVESHDAPDRVRKGMGQYSIPVVVLARLAVASASQGQGMGVVLLMDAMLRSLLIAEKAGVRALLTHPIDEEASSFYLRFGFEASPLLPNQLVLLLKDVRRLLG